MLNWQSPGSEGESSAPVSLANQHQLKCKRRKYCLPLTGSIVLLGKLWPRLWPKQLPYRIYWDYNSYRDIWPCKWVQTICQAICHLEECHFANAGRRHYRFFLAVCATWYRGWGNAALLPSLFHLVPQAGAQEIARISRTSGFQHV